MRAPSPHVGHALDITAITRREDIIIPRTTAEVIESVTIGGRLSRPDITGVKPVHSPDVVTTPRVRELITKVTEGIL